MKKVQAKLILRYCILIKLGFICQVQVKICYNINDNYKNVATLSLVNILGLDMAGDNTEDFILTELEKTKHKLRQITKNLEVQQQFLRLIVQVRVMFIMFKVIYSVGSY